MTNEASTERRVRAALRLWCGSIDVHVRAAVALTLLAAVIRLPTLAEQSFWLDEGYTQRLVRMSFPGMLQAIPRTESTPPVYYALAWVWTHAFGYSELGLRSLSALAGIATIPVAFMVAERLAGLRAAVIAGLLLAVSPLMVWFSQEARAYALATLLATMTLLCLVRYLEHRRAVWLWGWAVCAAVGLATHYFVVFVVIPELGWLWWRSGRERRTIPAISLVAAVAAALVPLALAQRGTGHADYIARGSLVTRLVQVPKQFLLGYASPGQVVTVTLATLLVVAGVLVPILTDRDVRARATWPLIVGAVAAILPAAFALVGMDFVNTRNLLPALPALTVAAAIGFGATRRSGVVCAGLLALISVVVVILVDTHSRYQRADWRGAALGLGTFRQPRVIAVDPGSGLIPLQIYLTALRPLARPARVSELDVIVMAGQVTGGGIGSAPRPSGPLPVPSGFRLIGATYAGTYTVLRYRSAMPVMVGPAIAATGHTGIVDYAPLLQAR